VDNRARFAHTHKYEAEIAACLGAPKARHPDHSAPSGIASVLATRDAAPGRAIVRGTMEGTGNEMTLATEYSRQPHSDAYIVERIVTAVIEQKLPPGAKLPEAVLCDAFACNRSQIRRVLVKLAERGVVALEANRGAFVARPSAGDARDVFAARQAIERAIVFAVAQRIDAAALKALKALLAKGAEANAREDRDQSIRLSGQFHLMLAEIAGNPVLAKFMGELIARTSLIVGLYGSPATRSCSEHEHATLIEALAARDAERAAELMQRHLLHLEDSLDIRDDACEPADIRQIFAE
jgi:DNA-binding GntR family transcriptional regulator